MTPEDRPKLADAVSQLAAAIGKDASPKLIEFFTRIDQKVAEKSSTPDILSEVNEPIGAVAVLYAANLRAGDIVYQENKWVKSVRVLVENSVVTVVGTPVDNNERVTRAYSNTARDLVIIRPRAK